MKIFLYFLINLVYLPLPPSGFIFYGHRSEKSYKVLNRIWGACNEGNEDVTRMLSKTL